MPWTAPVNPVSGTVITVAYAVSNILDPIRWLRLLAGNADPPGSNYVLTSDSISAVTWKQLGAAIVSGGGLGYTPMNRAGDTMSGSQLIISRSQGALTGAYATAPLMVQSPDAGANPLETAGIGLHRLGASGVYLYHAGAAAADLLRFIRHDGVAGTVLTSLSMGAGSGTDADLLDGSQGAYYLARANHTGTQLAATISNFAATATAATTATTATNATTVGGKAPTATKTANAIPIADATGSLDSWITGGGGGTPIPVGLGGWVRTAAEIPAGFARETSLDGLMLIGAGTSFSQTFNETQTYGSTWVHNHSIPVLTVAVSSVSVSGSATGGTGDNTGASSAVNGLASAGGVNLNTTGHTHPLNGVSLAVSASGSGSGATTAGTAGNTTWLPPMRAVVWVRKT